MRYYIVHCEYGFVQTTDNEFIAKDLAAINDYYVVIDTQENKQIFEDGTSGDQIPFVAIGESK